MADYDCPICGARKGLRWGAWELAGTWYLVWECRHCGAESKKFEAPLLTGAAGIPKEEVLASVRPKPRDLEDTRDDSTRG